MYRAEDTIDYSIGPVRRTAEMGIVMVYPYYQNQIQNLVFHPRDPITIWREGPDGIVRCIDGMTLLRINYQAKRDKVLSEWNYENTLMQDIQLTDIEIISNNHGYEKVPVDSLRYQDDKRFYKLNCYPILSILTTKPELRMRTEIDTEFKDLHLLTNKDIISTHHITKSFGYKRDTDDHIRLTSIALYDYKSQKVVISDFIREFFLDTLYSFDERVGYEVYPKCKCTHFREQVNKSIDIG